MKTFDPMNDRIAVIGLGYVGLPLSLLLARQFLIIGFDTDIEKIKKIKIGESPITEPGVDKLLFDKDILHNLQITHKTSQLKSAKIKIITVGTPYDSVTDYIDYSQLNEAFDLLKNNLRNGDIIILKSTVPPGTTNKIVRGRIEGYGFKVPDEIGIAFSPERMVEGQAIKDFTSLPKIIGASDSETFDIVATLPCFP